MYQSFDDNDDSETSDGDRVGAFLDSTSINPAILGGISLDTALIDCTAINIAVLDSTLLDTGDDDRADGGRSTMRSVLFQSL